MPGGAMAGRWRSAQGCCTLRGSAGLDSMGSMHRACLCVPLHAERRGVPCQVTHRLFEASGYPYLQLGAKHAGGQHARYCTLVGF